MDLDTAEINGAASLEEVSVNSDAGDHIIQTDTRCTMLRTASYIAPPIPANNDTAIQRITEHIEPTLII